MRSTIGGLGATSSSAEIASACPSDRSIAAGGMPPIRQMRRACERLRYIRPANDFTGGPSSDSGAARPPTLRRCASVNSSSKAARACGDSRSGNTSAKIRAGPLEIERVRRTDGGNRPRLDDPEAGFVAAPLHVLRRAVVRFHLLQERRQRGDLVVAQRRGAVRAAFAEMSQEQLVRAFANDVPIRIDRAADQRLAKPARGVDDDLVREPGDRIDGEADARHLRSNHPLDQDGYFDRVDGQPGRLPIGMRARRPGRGTTGRHGGGEPAARHVEESFVDTRKRLGGTVLADARRPDGKEAVGRHAIEPLMRRDRRNCLVARIGEDHQAIRHRESGLFQAGAVEGFAPGPRLVDGANPIEGSERIERTRTSMHVQNGTSFSVVLASRIMTTRSGWRKSVSR